MHRYSTNLVELARILVVICALALAHSPAQAENANKTEQALSSEQLIGEIARAEDNVKDLEQRLTGAKGFYQIAIDSRLVHARMNLLERNLALLVQFADNVKAGQADDERHQLAIKVFESQLKTIDATEKMLIGRAVPPEEKLPAAETAAAFSRIFETIDRLNRVYEINIASLQQAEHFELDVTAATEKVKHKLLERAENSSVFLEITMSQVTALRASVAAVPGDTETQARLNVFVTLVSDLAGGVVRILDMMNSLDMDTTNYQNQLLTATGQITTDVFQVDVFTNLLVGWGNTLWTQLIESGPGLIFKLLLLVIIVFIFYKLAGLAQKLTVRALEDPRVELSQLLKRMVISIVRNSVLIIGLLIALSQIGISLGPLLAGMGVVGFVVGFALQDTLSNFAAGLLILIYRPFDVDDVIEAGGVSGQVSKMSLVNTTILTFDNQTIIVPNGKIWGDIIKNVTAQTERRVDLVFGIGYGDDIEKTEKVLAEVVAAHPAVLDEPETMIRVHELGESSVNFIVRPWVDTDDYWETYWDLTRAVKLRFDEEGISIPFPQRDVHLYKD